MRALGLLLALLALIAAGCGDGATMEEAPTTTSAASLPKPPANANRPPAPAIEGTSLDGERISLADFRGRPLFVNVWSSW